MQNADKHVAVESYPTGRVGQATYRIQQVEPCKQVLSVSYFLSKPGK